MPLFQVAILEKPTPKGVENGEAERLIAGPLAVVGKDPMAAALTAALDGKLPDFDRSRMEVIVVPFG